MEDRDKVGRRQTRMCLPSEALDVRREQTRRPARGCLGTTAPARPFLPADVVAEGVRRRIEARDAG